MLTEPSPDEIRDFRTQLELTQSEFGSRIGAATRTVEDWEAARRKAPAMLRLVMGAVARGVAPWKSRGPLGPTSTLEDVDREVERIFSVLGDEYTSRISDEFSDCAPEDVIPAERLLFAAVTRLSDGYNRAETIKDWADRPQTGWQTSLAFRPNLDMARPTLALECRLDKVIRQLAVFVDTHRPGERLPEKVRVETTLLARGFNVISFSATDVLVDYQGCCETIETVMCELAEEVLHEAGKIEKPWKRPDRS